MVEPIPTSIVPSVRSARANGSRVEREFRRRLAKGASIVPAGAARKRPLRLLSLGYTPKYQLRLFDTTFYLTRVRQNEDIRFFVGYVVRDRPGAPGRAIYPRIFYKDVSLVWRAASHYSRSDSEDWIWIGKGELRTFRDNGIEIEATDESTTDLPLEIQSALEELSHGAKRIRYDEAAVGLVLRRAPEDRIEAYRDFTEPLRRARSDPRNRVNGGRSVARFTRKNDPSSLRFVAGYEPDFARGVVESSTSTSRMYGGRLRRFRILSTNREIQYLFIAGPRHAWIIPAQATTTELSSYGVRTVSVVADEDLFVPGFEYHSAYGSSDIASVLHQIPKGFAGAANAIDPSRSDASAWLDRLPIIQEFRRKVLKSNR